MRNRRLVILIILLVTLFLGCKKESPPTIKPSKVKKEILIKDKIVKEEIRLPHGTYLDVINLKGHEYLVVGKYNKRGGVSIAHSESCTCFQNY